LRKGRHPPKRKGIKIPKKILYGEGEQLVLSERKKDPGTARPPSGRRSFHRAALPRRKTGSREISPSEENSQKKKRFFPDGPVFEVRRKKFVRCKTQALLSGERSPEKEKITTVVFRAKKKDAFEKTAGPFRKKGKKKDHSRT